MHQLGAQIQDGSAARGFLAETAGGGAGFSIGGYIVGVAARKMFNATVRERAKDCRLIGQGLLEEVIAQQSPSVSGKALREYERVRKVFSPKDKGMQRAAIGFR